MKREKRRWKRLFMRRMSRRRSSNWRKRSAKKSWRCRLRWMSWWRATLAKNAGSKFALWRGGEKGITNRRKKTGGGGLFKECGRRRGGRGRARGGRRGVGGKKR